MLTIFSIRKNFAFLRLAILFFVTGTVLYINYFKISPSKLIGFSNLLVNEINFELPPWISQSQVNNFIQERLETDQIKSQVEPRLTCRLPNLPLFNKEIMPVLRTSFEPLNCANFRFPLLFNSKLKPSPRLIPIKNLVTISSTYGVRSCCMRKISEHLEGPGNDEVVYGNDCINLSFENLTLVPMNWTFLRVECQFFVFNRKEKRYSDVFSFIKLNKTEHPKISYPANNEAVPPPNVFVMLMDSVSRLSFRRVLPEVHDLLLNELSAVEIKNFHKIGINTFPNLMALLTGQQVKYKSGNFLHNQHLECENNLLYDNCPLVWKLFKDAGYLTFYGEDFGWTSEDGYIFYNGFNKQLTDVSLRALNIAAKSIGTKGLGNEIIGEQSFKCCGSRPRFEVLLDNFKIVAQQANSFKFPYFAALVSGSITHEKLNDGRIVAKDILNLLKFFQDEGQMNNTILFFLSDHGLLFGEMRNHLQGYLEERLPFLYVVVPKWFSKTNHEEYINLRKNADTKLVTHFDVHQTLVNLFQKAKFGNFRDSEKNKSGQGISLFSPIPADRTCEAAGIPESLCTCNLQITPVATNEPDMVKVANQAVSEINQFLNKTDKQKLCEPLTLNETLSSVDIISNSKTNVTDLHRIVFETLPGNANFEVLIRFNPNVSFIHVGGSFYFESNQFRASLGRINTYVFDSWCTEATNLKPFCYCRDNEKTK